MDTLIDILDEAVATYGDRPALSLRRDDGTNEVWSFRELDRRSRAVAWRLRELGPEARRPDAHLVALDARRCRPSTSGRCGPG